MLFGVCVEHEYDLIMFIVILGLCEDYLTCDIAFNAVMPLSRASTRGRYSRIVGVTLQIKQRLAKDEVTMRVGNGSKVDVIAVGTLPLHLPSGLVLDLDNYYLVSALSMNIISGSCLMRDRYSFKS